MRPVDSSSTATSYQPVQHTPPPPPPAPEKNEKKGLLSRMRDGFDGAIDKGKQFVDKAVEVGGNVVDKAEELADVWKENLDYEKQIDKLGKSDKYSLSLGGDLSAEGAKGYAKARRR